MSFAPVCVCSFVCLCACVCKLVMERIDKPHLEHSSLHPHPDFELLFIHSGCSLLPPINSVFMMVVKAWLKYKPVLLCSCFSIKRKQQNVSLSRLMIQYIIMGEGD